MPFSNSADPRDSRKRKLVWFGLFIISMTGLVIMSISGVRQREYARCNAEQVSILIQWQRESSAAAAEERKAHDAVRRAQQAENVPATKLAIERYFETRKISDERRSKNPLPQLPETVCGKESSLP